VNFIVNVIIQHVIAAFQQGWKTTVTGIIVAVIGVLQASIPLIEGHPIDQINWTSIGTKLITAIGLVLAKDITITKIIEGAPKAKPVKPE
jgi:hypothetical protein